MGAKHPQDLINKLSANKNEFILACSYLVRMGIVKRGPMLLDILNIRILL